MSFHEISKQVVEDYLGTVAYVDDLIFSINNDIAPEDLGKQDMREVAAKKIVIEVAEPIDEQSKQRSPNINPVSFTNAFIAKGVHCALMELAENKSNLDAIKKTLNSSGR